MKEQRIIKHIINWLKNYSKESSTKGFVIGISGGIDSAVTSVLAAKTNLPLICLEMPILQQKEHKIRSKEHIDFLKKEYPNVRSVEVELTDVFLKFKSCIGNLECDENLNKLSLANCRARLRMTTLYYYAQINNFLVLGTGNKVEDFGIGFFTKYGDGGVDISPIADLLKTEVYCLGETLGICSSILEAEPSDGLWDDKRTDRDQIGASYSELEWAMNFDNKSKITARQKIVLEIYRKLNNTNKHKMKQIPVCVIPDKIK